MKKITVCLIAGVFLLTVLSGFSFVNTVKADAGDENEILYVGGTGDGNYTSIQSAIDDAQHIKEVAEEYLDNKLIQKYREMLDGFY